MEKQLTPNNQLTQIPSNLTSTVKELNSSLQAIAPSNSETTQIITYVLVGTVVAGLLVYHYIKNQESLV
jgi:hypothetical protein